MGPDAYETANTVLISTNNDKVMFTKKMIYKNPSVYNYKML